MEGIMRGYRDFILRTLTLAVIVCVAQPVWAIRFDWSPAELECASQLDIDLQKPTDPESPTFERHLAWIADLVVYGQVSSVKHDIKGPYRTIVGLSVVSTLKGAKPTGPIHVDLISGPQHVEEKSAIIEFKLIGEPTFREGEAVVLFLTTGTIGGPAPGLYELAQNHFRLIDNVKWSVQGGYASQDGALFSHSHSLTWLFSEIDRAVKTQSLGCE